MKILLTKNQICAMDKTLQAFGFEFINLNNTITEEYSEYTIEDFKLSSKFDENTIRNINGVYNHLVTIKRLKDDGVEIWLNDKFICDYIDIYERTAVEMFRCIQGFILNMKFMIMPMIDKFYRTWFKPQDIKIQDDENSDIDL